MANRKQMPLQNICHTLKMCLFCVHVVGEWIFRVFGTDMKRSILRFAKCSQSNGSSHRVHRLKTTLANGLGMLIQGGYIQHVHGS